MIALIADICHWIGEGNLSLSLLIIVANAVSSSAAYLAMFFYILYLKENMFRSERVVKVFVFIFGFLCLLSIVYLIINAYSGLDFFINEHGHYVHNDNFAMMTTHLAFPLFALVISTMMIFVAEGIPFRNRLFYLSYSLFPTIGVVFDYIMHGWSLTYIGMAIAALIIYANVYFQKSKLINDQKIALMMSQINPHFMYNTLTTIASLCEIEPKEAKELTIEFSHFLRQNLDTMSSTELVPFEQELRHIGCYLKIEKARFKERVNVVYAINCKNFYLPPLSLQPLVENAVKHGITKKIEGGTVKISTYQEDKYYVVEIKDDGVGFIIENDLENERSHIGINNVRGRLREMCGGILEVKSLPGVGTRATVKIPVKNKKESIRHENLGG